MERLSVKAYAKLNLSLDVLERLPSGFHRVTTVLQTISLADEVWVSKGQELEVTCDQPEVPQGAGNLAYQAARLLLQSCDYRGGALVEIKKSIPVAAGLAGGSADAAATLIGLNYLLGLGLPPGRLIELGARVGSDVPFCLLGGTALGKGRGEELCLLPQPPHFWLVLAKPHFGVSAASAYQAWDELVNPFHPDVEGLVAALGQGDRRGMLSRMGNALEEATARLFPEVRKLKEILLGSGAKAALMCGSGPTVCGVCSSQESADKLASSLPEGYMVWVARTI